MSIQMGNDEFIFYIRKSPDWNKRLTGLENKYGNG